MGYLFLRVSQESSNAQGESTAATSGYTAAELAAVLLLVISFKHRYNQIQFFHVFWLRSTLLWLPSSALLIFLFSNGRGLLSASLSKSRILRLIGNLSSFTYLIHPYCIELVKSIPQDSSFQKGFAMLVAFLITHMAAYCYSQLLDRSLA